MSRIYTRAQWGARHQNGVGNRPTGALQKYFHHDAMGTSTPGPGATLAQDAAHMRALESVGQQRFGAGISYSFGISRAGRIFVGADVQRIAYHSGTGRNTRGCGIVLFGNYMNLSMTDPQFAALVWLLQEGVRRGWWGDPALTEAHRDFSATSCPGNNAYARFAAINAAGRGQSVTPTPSPTLPPSTGGGSGGSSGSGKASPPGTHAVANATITARLDAAGYPRMTYLRDRIARFQRDQLYSPGLKADGIWGPWTERHWTWVREFQAALNAWKAVTPKLQVDGDYRTQTGRGSKQHQDRNAGARMASRSNRRLPNANQRRMLGVRIHPGAS